MTSLPTELLLAAVCAILGGYGLLTGHEYGLLPLAAAGLLVYSHLRHGPVALAFRHVARGDYERGAALLGRVANPSRLSPENHAYFELASGFVALHRQQPELAEAHVREALRHPFRRANEHALAEAVLAQLLLAREESAEARALLTRAASRDCAPPTRARIEKMLESLSSG